LYFAIASRKATKQCNKYKSLNPRIVSRKFFYFARIKREDLFEVVACNNESCNARAKLKIRGYPNKDDTTAWQVLCLFLACSNWGPQNACRFGAKKTVAKALDLAKKKRIAWIPAFPHDTRFLQKLVVRSRE
jgi:hypothetical protein